MTIDALLKMTQIQIGELFSTCEAGPIPDGVMDGVAIVAPGTYIGRQLARHIQLFAWQGKTFDAKRMVVTNRLLGLNAIMARIYRGPSWFDHKECIVLDYSVTPLAAVLRDEIREIEPGLYLGKAYRGTIQMVHFTLQQGAEPPRSK